MLFYFENTLKTNWFNSLRNYADTFNIHQIKNGDEIIPSPFFTGLNRF